jgi:hypothetical protein
MRLLNPRRLEDFATIQYATVMANLSHLQFLDIVLGLREERSWAVLDAFFNHFRCS